MSGKRIAISSYAVPRFDRDSGSLRLLDLNAWNEWAEGCHLEPDQLYGRGYLEQFGVTVTERDQGGFCGAS